MKNLVVGLFFCFVVLSLQGPQNCNGGAKGNILANVDILDLELAATLNEGCDDMDKCQVDCSNFVPGCNQKSILGFDLTSEYSGRVFNFVCRKDFFGIQTNSASKLILAYARERAKTNYNFELVELSQHLLNWQIRGNAVFPQFGTYDNPKLTQPAQTLYVFSTLLTFFGDLCQKTEFKNRAHVGKNIDKFYDGKNVFKLRDGPEKDSIAYVRELVKRYLAQSKDKRLLNGIRVEKKVLRTRRGERTVDIQVPITDEQVLLNEWNLMKEKMIDIVLSPRDICPCNLLTRFINDFNGQEQSGFRTRLGFYALEGWQDPGQCQTFNSDFIKGIEVARSMCRSVCGKDSLQVGQILKSPYVFNGCNQGDVFGREAEFKL